MDNTKKYYKLWLHAEEITVDEAGQDADYASLDEEFMPIALKVCDTKEAVQQIWDRYEDVIRSINTQH